MLLASIFLVPKLPPQVVGFPILVGGSPGLIVGQRYPLAFYRLVLASLLLFSFLQTSPAFPLCPWLPPFLSWHSPDLSVETVSFLLGSPASPHLSLASIHPCRGCRWTCRRLASSSPSVGSRYDSIHLSDLHSTPFRLSSFQQFVIHPPCPSWHRVVGCRFVVSVVISIIPA